MNAQKLIVALLALTSITSLSHAQANYAESFQNVGSGTDAAGGPPTLVSRGWTFRNQSRPANSGISPYWSEFPAWGQTGSSLGHGGFATWQNSSSRISAWAILPAMPNQVAGDPLSIWTSGPSDAFGGNTATLEIRYSPTGNISTGSNENDIGSFTTLLGSYSGAHPWTQRLLALPGTGRIAVRLVIGPGASQQIFGGSMMIDSLQVGNPPATPYPMPGAGQTVHWSSIHSPVQIAQNGAGQNPRIVAGATVIVDPGVEVRVAAGAKLQVSGTMQLAGTAQSSVRLRGPGSIVVEPAGLLAANFADVQSFTDLLYGGKASFTDSTFTDPTNPTGFSYDSAGDVGHRFFDGDLSYTRQILSLTRCNFGQGCDVAILRGWVAARDCTFYRGGQVTTSTNPVGGEAMFIVGNAILDNVTVTEGYINLMQDHHQHRYVGNVSVTGNADGPGIRLEGGGNYLIDSNVTLANNKWPVNIGVNSAGILPGSVLPSKGNQNNEIPDTDDSAPLDERVTWADAGIPYRLWNASALHGRVTILPGVTAKIDPDVSFFFDTDSNGVSMPVFLGEPERPIRFVPAVPGSKWMSLVAGGSLWFGTRWQWCEFEGSQYGVAASGMPLALDNCTFRNNHRALYTENYVSVRGSTFENNVYSITGERFAPLHEVRGFLDANHPANPNTFINNHGTPGDGYTFTFLPNGGLIAKARHNSLENTDSDVRNNWWGTPTGPKHPQFNPSGLGDAVFFGIDSGGYLLPFLTQPPISNPPPVVRFITEGQAVNPGEKIVVTWTARDDGSITRQRVYYSPDSNIDASMQLLGEISPGARAFEWTVPTIGTQPNGPDQYLRVVAVDNLNQEGIADLPLRITNPSGFTGSLSPTGIPALVRPGDNVTACASGPGTGGSIVAALELDNDDGGVSLGGVFAQGGSACTLGGIQIPDVSTDRARIRFDSIASLNQVKSDYGPYFTIRPDPMLGDAAPTITLQGASASPGANGAVITTSWTASDDEGLRGFDIRASFDGGVRWFIIARDLPATATSHSWTLATQNGISNARIRVVAKDKRFQNTSAESAAFAIPAGSVVAPGDANGDGQINVADLLMVITGWGSCPVAPATCPADVNHDGLVNVSDLLLVITNWS